MAVVCGETVTLLDPIEGQVMAPPPFLCITVTPLPSAVTKDGEAFTDLVLLGDGVLARGDTGMLLPDFLLPVGTPPFPPTPSLMLSIWGLCSGADTECGTALAEVD